MSESKPLPKELLTPQVIQSQAQYTWTPTTTFANDLLRFLQSKYPEGSLRIHRTYEQFSRYGPGEYDTSISGRGVIPEGMGMYNIDINVVFRRRGDAAKTPAINTWGPRAKELMGFVNEFLDDKVARIKAKAVGRNLRAFTTPGVKEKLNTLPENVTSELVGFLSGNTKTPSVKVEELKSFVARPSGGKRKTRGRR